MKHYEGCSGWLCPCGEVDLRIRLSPEAQLAAIYDAESYFYFMDPDPGSEWIGHLLPIGWTEEDIYSPDGRRSNDAR